MSVSWFLLNIMLLSPLVQGASYYCEYYCESYFYDYPSSTNTFLGSSSAFSCWVHINDAYACYHYDDHDIVLNWVINGSSYNNTFTDYTYYPENVTYFSNEDGSINITAQTLYDYIVSDLYIRATGNTEIQCGIQVIGCPNQTVTGPTAVLSVQGLLEAPTNLQLTDLNSQTIELSWDHPSTLAGVPILQYSVYITQVPDNTVTVETTSSTQHHIQKPCGSIRLSVSAWNEVGEGAHSLSVEYTSDTLTPHYMAVSTPDKLLGTICVSCSFLSDSQAQGCHGKIVNMNEMSSTDLEVSFNVTRRNLETFTVLDCITGLKTGDYAVEVGEIECSGYIGHTYIEWQDIAVIGDHSESTPTPSPSSSPQPSPSLQPALVDDESSVASASEDSAAVSGLAVVTALLGVALVALITTVLVYVAIKFLRRWKRTEPDGGAVTSKVPKAIPSANPYDADRYERTYETIELTPEQSTPGLPTDTYENVQFSPPPQAGPAPPAVGIDMGPCAAYGFVRRQ